MTGYGDETGGGWASAARAFDMSSQETLQDHTAFLDKLRERITRGIDSTLNESAAVLRAANGEITSQVDEIIDGANGQHAYLSSNLGLGIDGIIADSRTLADRILSKEEINELQSIADGVTSFGDSGSGSGTPPEEPPQYGFCAITWPKPDVPNTICYYIAECRYIPPRYFEPPYSWYGPFDTYGEAFAFVQGLPGFKVQCGLPPGEPPPPPPQPPVIQPPIGEPPLPPIQPPPIEPPPIQPPPIPPPPIGEPPIIPPPPPPPPCPQLDPCYPSPTIMVNGGSHTVRPLRKPFWMGIRCTSICTAEWACWEGDCPPLTGNGWRIFGPFDHCQDPDPFVRLCITGSWPPGVSRPPVSNNGIRPPGVEEPPPPPKDPPPDPDPTDCLPIRKHPVQWDAEVPFCLDEAEWLRPQYEAVAETRDVNALNEQLLASYSTEDATDPMEKWR